MMQMLGQFLAWYIVVMLIGLAALPLTLRLFENLPDRGYAFARILGILLTGYLFWLAYSFGLVRFEPGAAWLVLLAVLGISVLAARKQWSAWRTARATINWRYVLVVELLFLLAFAAWATVRAYDPAANHTEKPMDLMFMNSIRGSAIYPPQDAWLSGQPISYYYFGYWMLTTLGQLSGQPPEIAYNLGQACWYGLLLTGSFAIVYNLLRLAGRRFNVAAAGGLLSAVMVGVAANVQGILEWLYAMGVPIGPIAAFFQVPGFPQEAAVTGKWYIDSGWWWWRSSRVIEDLDLMGNHIEVIDEFPAFSYILGDNHPHVLAMPFVLLVIALALNLLLARVSRAQSAPASGSVTAQRAFARLHALMPLGWGGWLVLALATGALLFFNTWDYPFYWLLIVAALFFALLWEWRRSGDQRGVAWALGLAVAAGVGMAVAAWLLYLPYFLTAQSQARGIIPNLFNPTKLPQFLAMFAAAMLLMGALVWLAWREVRPKLVQLVGVGAVVFGAPILFLLVSGFIVANTEAGAEMRAGMALPDGAQGHAPFMLERWLGQPFTFLLLGVLVACVLALIWRRTAPDVDFDASPAARPLLFALLMAALGLGLVFAPEFVFLRDNFGSRMNTIFKFYYQAWLLFGLAGAYTATIALGGWRGWRIGPAIMSTIAVVLVLASTVYILAGAYAKTGGLSGEATFDATAYLAAASPDEMTAIQWLRANTRPDDVIVEAKGGSYRVNMNRVSSMTGRPTLLGWDGHESQWRGVAYGKMAAGRAEALEAIYRAGAPEQIEALVDQWGIDYVFVGPAERTAYGVTPSSEERLRRVMDLVFESGAVTIYRAR
ncbi:MAG: hypothetical protein IPK16_00160 [Anaerolineales bacterium]|nr:hypothetical protein [Anaerolineales bacterium]